MNKKDFIKELSKQTGYSEEKCILIDNILENYFIFNKNNREKIIKDLQVNASLSEDDSENVYDIAIKIIKDEIKNKIKHPFKSQDKKRNQPLVDIKNPPLNQWYVDF